MERYGDPTNKESDIVMAEWYSRLYGVIRINNETGEIMDLGRKKGIVP